MILLQYNLSVVTLTTGSYSIYVEILSWDCIANETVSKWFEKADHVATKCWCIFEVLEWLQIGTVLLKAIALYTQNGTIQTRGMKMWSTNLLLVIFVNMSKFDTPSFLGNTFCLILFHNDININKKLTQLFVTFPRNPPSL